MKPKNFKDKKKNIYLPATKPTLLDSLILLFVSPSKGSYFNDEKMEIRTIVYKTYNNKMFILKDEPAYK